MNNLKYENVELSLKLQSFNSKSYFQKFEDFKWIIDNIRKEFIKIFESFSEEKQNYFKIKVGPLMNLFSEFEKASKKVNNISFATNCNEDLPQNNFNIEIDKELRLLIMKI